MTIEVSSDLTARARCHAALSDPSRLAIVDALTLTDLSPGEIGQLLGLPSNLVAHHVNVLVEARLVSRHRSQGDGRRSYLRLEESVLGSIAVTPTWKASRVVFVCRQNSARSQLAAALWRRRSEVPAESAGTDPAPAVHPGAIAAARRHRLAMRRPRPKSWVPVVRDFDVVITVCDEAHEELAARTDRTVLHWSVPDPVRIGTDAAFDAAFAEIAGRVARAAVAVSTEDQG